MNGGKADALNAGLNHCRYRYVCGVDADMVFAPTAFTRAMREISGDPEHIVGLTSYFENARDPARVLENGLQQAGPDTRPLFAFQTFDYLRAFFNNRMPWARMNFMLCAAGAFQLWRRDLVEDLGGWSRSSPARTSSSPSACIEPCASAGAPTGSPASPTASA